MSYANRKQMSSNRTLAIVMVALVNGVLGYALVNGLAYNVIKKAAEDLKTFDVEDEPPPPPDKPPPPPEEAPPPPQVAAPPPLVRIDTPSPPLVTTPVINPNPPITPVARPAPPAPAAPPPPRISQQAAPKGSLTGLFSGEDYPPAAQRNGDQGTTAVRLTIGTDGRVSDCSVTASSGSSSLDSATCSIIRRRARFTPAKDQAGGPTTGSYSQRIKWVLPDDE
jgi:protein TonB